MQFIYDLIKKILLGKLYNSLLYGEMDFKKKVLYINDLIDIILAIYKDKENITYNIS